MAHYKVQAGDTPAIIAQKLTGNYRNASALINANPQKAKMTVPEGLTFRSLKVNELLALPGNWGLGTPYVDQSPVVFPKNSPPTTAIITNVKGIGAFGLGDPLGDASTAANAVLSAYTADGGVAICNDASGNGNATVLAFQQAYNLWTTGQHLDEDGKYGPNTKTGLQNVLTAAGSSNTAPTDCQNYNAPTAAMATASDVSVIAAEVAGDFTLCQGYNLNVAAFQDAYNAANSGATLGVSQDYGFYTAATAAALAGMASSLPSYLTAPPACTNFPNPAGPGSGGTPYVPPPPGPYVPPTPPTPVTNVTTNVNNNTPLILGIVALVAAGGVFYYLHNKKHGSSVPASSAPRLGMGAQHPALARRRSR